MEWHYWTQCQAKEAGYKRNTAILRSAVDAIAKANGINDSLVFSHDSIPDAYVVGSTNRAGQFALVLDASSDSAHCSCYHAVQGNICKHLAKVRLTKCGWTADEVRLYYVSYREPGAYGLTAWPGRVGYIVPEVHAVLVDGGAHRRGSYMFWCVQVGIHVVVFVYGLNSCRLCPHPDRSRFLEGSKGKG